MIRTLLIFLLVLSLAPTSSWAADGVKTKTQILEEAKKAKAEQDYDRKLQRQDLKYQDSIDYILDDGVMSPEEMKKEAEYIYGLCAGNAFQKNHFNCQCLSGAFLLERERLGPTALQSDIMQELTQSDKAKCANVESVAGQTYKTCMEYSTNFRELATDHEEMCTCAANNVAREFGKRPLLDPSYVGMLNTRYFVRCSKPENRKSLMPPR